MKNAELLFPAAESIPETDLALARTIREWADKEVIPKRLELGESRTGLLAPAMHTLFIDLEMQKLTWPEQNGGVGLTGPEAAVTIALALEQVGRADAGIGYLLSAGYALLDTFTAEDSQNEELCRELAPLFCATGQAAIGAPVLPRFAGPGEEAEAASFRGRLLPARARREGSSWVVNGRSLRPLNSGLDAAIFGVLCALEGEDEPGLIILPARQPGIARGPEIKNTGLAANRNAELNLENVRVPAANLVFTGETGLKKMLTRFYLGAGAVTVGALFCCFEIISEWGNTRVIKGRGNLFKENPLTAGVMAEISREILMSRLLLHRLASMLSGPGPGSSSGVDERFITALGVTGGISASAERAINRAMELMGSAGYAAEWNLERCWRDVKTIQVHLGSPELNGMELARYFFRSQSL